MVHEKRRKSVEEVKRSQFHKGNQTNVVMLKKTSGKWRMCVDFTKLNPCMSKALLQLTKQ